MNVALILVSLGIANAPEPISHPLVVAYSEDITLCAGAANQAQLPVPEYPDVPPTLGRSSCACRRTNASIGKSSGMCRAPVRSLIAARRRWAGYRCVTGL
jgi:hypothetical protein